MGDENGCLSHGGNYSGASRQTLCLKEFDLSIENPFVSRDAIPRSNSLYRGRAKYFGFAITNDPVVASQRQGPGNEHFRSV
jgi:hypothetical protein